MENRVTYKKNVSIYTYNKIIQYFMKTTKGDFYLIWNGLKSNTVKVASKG